MMARNGTLRNESAKSLVPSTASYPKEVKNEAKEVQNTILCDNNPELFNRCIICNKETKSRGDHYVSAIMNKRPRFRNGFLIATNHPMNMVTCCKNPQCNNERKKMTLINTVERYKKYHDYVLENCPYVNITEEEYDTFDRNVTEMMESRAKQMRELFNKGKTPIIVVDTLSPPA